MTGDAIAVIRGSVGPGDWRQAPAGKSGDATIVAHRRIYYPYDWFLFRCRTRTWLGATAMHLSCLVDCRTRVSATTDPFEMQRLHADDALVMERRIDPGTSLSLARRYAAYTLRQKHKALVLPRIEVAERRPIYKPFWVVDCRMSDGMRHELLVDGLTGEYCGLSAKAAVVAC